MTTTVTRTGPIGRTTSIRFDVESDEMMSPDFDVGGYFRPEQLRLTWVWREETDTWRLDTAQVVGPRLKNDGTPSRLPYGKRDFARRYSTTGEHLVDETPQWVRDQVGLYAPTAR